MPVKKNQVVLTMQEEVNTSEIKKNIHNNNKLLEII